jgi:NADPH:quinone reductase-like Zn-dependent oxidoreductase
VASLLLFYPPYYLFKTCYSFLSWLFPEDLAGKVVLITGASSGIGEVTPTVCRLLTVNYSSTTDIMQSHKLKRGLLFFTCSVLHVRFTS